MTQLAQVVIGAAVARLLRVITLAITYVTALLVGSGLEGVLLGQLLESLVEVVVFLISFFFYDELTFCVFDEIFDERGHGGEEKVGMGLVRVWMYSIVAGVALDEAREEVLYGILHANCFANLSKVLKKLPLLLIWNQPWVL